MQFKTEYFKKPDSKRSNIVISLKRPDVKELRKWTDAEKKDVLKYLENAEEVFLEFKRTILKELGNL